MDILRIIPLDSSGLSSSPTGERPEPSYGWLGELVAGIIESIVGIFVAIFGAIFQLFNTLLGWAAETLLSVVVALGASNLPFIEEIFKAIILIYVFTRFAITMIFKVVFFDFYHDTSFNTSITVYFSLSHNHLILK